MKKFIGLILVAVLLSLPVQAQNMPFGKMQMMDTDNPYESCMRFCLIPDIPYDAENSVRTFLKCHGTCKELVLRPMSIPTPQ